MFVSFSLEEGGIYIFTNRYSYFYYLFCVLPFGEMSFGTDACMKKEGPLHWSEMSGVASLGNFLWGRI